MKVTYMRFFILIFISFFSFCCIKDNSEISNKIDSIVANDRVWYVSEFPNSCPATCVCPHKIMFGKDTTINSNIYKTILDYSSDSIESNSKACVLGYMRETSDKKVYWHVSLFGRPASDILIYDFNAKINDTIDNHWIVRNIDTIKIMNTNRKRITVSDCETQEKYWIDGIGDMSDLLSYRCRAYCNYKGGPTGETVGCSWYNQTCVKNDSGFIYKDSLTNDCWIYNGYK